MRIAILAPINNSLYSRLLTWACIQEPGIEVSGVVVRTAWSWKRISGEIRRDGPRLLNKVYQKLILGEQVSQGDDPYSLSAMAKAVALPGKNLSDLCQNHHIPIMNVKDHNETQAVEFLNSENLVAILFTGGGLIRKNILEASRLGVINCHAGLLPKYRGMDVVEWPLLESKTDNPEIGLSLHIMDRGLDTGPILIKRPIKIQNSKNFDTIRTHFGPEMVDLMLEGLRKLRDEKIHPQEQNLEDGRQYFVMHPRVKEAAIRKLANLK